jgi:Osmosensitive K+ channel histidine kinase
MRQILINLLNNAVKFTPDKGEISLIVKENPSIADNHVSYTFIVKDNGIGMSQNDLKVIFEPFSRIENGTSGRIEGTGLGLSICKSFVDAMGGHISVISHQGTGSTFTVILPFEILSNDVSIGVEVIDENISFQGKHVLLVEDNDINQTIATMMLEKLGFSVTVAKDGREGYTKFLTSQPYQFDLIFMDIQMPVMNGYEAAEAIRSSNHPQAQSIPIIAMTANVFKEDVAKARSSGMNAHIGKPLEMKDIIRAASRSLKREED